MDKTNVMRLLDAKKIIYRSLFFRAEVAPTGSEMADILGVPHESTYKTLVTKSGSNKNYVFMIPVDEELDLKKCAKSVNEKSIEMIKSKDLFGLTGYIHGGCSPIGMKKPFRTVVDDSVLKFSKIVFSAGKIGYMVEVSPLDLKKMVNYTTYDIKV